DVHGLPRRRAHRRHARAVHLRRPLRRDGRTRHGLRAALLLIRAGGARPGARRHRRDTRVARPVSALLRRLPHVPRAERRRSRPRRGDPRARPGRARPGPPRPCPLARAPGAARLRAEPGRLLPGAGGGEPLLPSSADDRRAGAGAARGPDRAALLAVRLRGRTRRRARRRVDGLGCRGDRGGGRGPARARREGGRRHCPPVPSVLRRRPRRRASAERARDRRPRPLQGPRRARRAALPGRRRGARGAARRAAARDRRPLRSRLEGVHAGDGGRRVRGAAVRAAAPPLHRRHPRRRLRLEPRRRRRLPHRAGRRRPRRLLRPRLGRHGRGEQELRQDHRRGDGPARPGLLRLRLEEGRLDDGLASALRAAPHPLHLPDRPGELRRLPPLRSAPAPGRARRGRARGDVPPQQPLRAGRGVGPPAARGAEADRGEAAALLRRRRGCGRPPGGAGCPREHRAPTVLLRAEAIAAIKDSIEKTYGKRGRLVVERNFAAVDLALAALHEVDVPDRAEATAAPAADGVPPLVRELIAGRGDELPVSAFVADGTFPTGTARYEKRSLADTLPIWDPDICIDCAKCTLVCPHAAIRMKVYEPAALEGAPEGFKHKQWRDRHLPGMLMTIQVAPDDCTGCGICVDTCPARSKEVAKHKSLDSEPKGPHLERERESWRFFLDIPEIDRTIVDAATVKGSQMLQPLFEFSGACSGCGETPYLKLLTQMFGDRMLVANATGCSSIYGGNLPTTPWSKDASGRGPAWSNSLFEDNAEFGLGMRLALDHQAAQARALLQQLLPDLAPALLDADQSDEAGIAAQRRRVDDVKARLSGSARPESRRLLGLIDSLVRKSVWIVGGDGWAYDIGFGGLDHVLASGRDVNILVLDTEVYSN